MLEVTVLPTMDEAIARALAHPDCAGAAEVVLRQTARALGLAHPDVDLAAAAEELLARGAPDPLALVAAARELAATGSSDLVDTLTDALDRAHGDGVAEGLARLHATLALTAVGAPIPATLQAPGPLPAPTPADLAALGGGLPGRGEAGPLTLARTIAAAALLPPVVEPRPSERWAVPFDEVVLQATAELLARDPAPDVVAWLVLGNAW